MFISFHSPYIEPGNLESNLVNHINLINNSGSNLNIFQELFNSEYESGDIYYISNYLNKARKILVKIHYFCKQKNKIAILSTPFQFKGAFYNFAVIVGLSRTIISDTPKILNFDLSPRVCLRIPSDVKNPFKI
tara:strand:- start:140 stop:538 length:399 start_codon:yes stop_codon:yes gene_type:complete